MAKTENELIVAALENIGAVGSGQSASAADIEQAGKYVAPMLADLAARRVVYVADSDVIEDEYFPWLVRILAYWASDAFGLPTNEDKRAMAEAMLRKVVAIGREPRDRLVLDNAVVRGFM